MRDRQHGGKDAASAVRRLGGEPRGSLASRQWECSWEPLPTIRKNCAEHVLLMVV